MKVQSLISTPSKSFKHIILVQCVNRCRYVKEVALPVCFERSDKRRHSQIPTSRNDVGSALSRKVTQLWHSSKCSLSCKIDQISLSPPLSIDLCELIYPASFPFTKKFSANSSIGRIIRTTCGGKETPCCVEERTWKRKRVSYPPRDLRSRPVHRGELVSCADTCQTDDISSVSAIAKCHFSSFRDRKLYHLNRNWRQN